MINRARGITLALFCSCLLLLSGRFRAVSAQNAAQARITPPALESFPRITTYLDVHDERGNFALDLGAENVEILEDGQVLPVSELSLLRPGAQFVVAVNPGAAFAIRDIQGNSRYDFLVMALQAWSEAHAGNAMDDLSLLTTGGSDVTHISDAKAWLSALHSYQPDLRTAAPDFDTLVRAIDVASDPSPQAGMGRGVLLITALPEQDIEMGLQSLAVRADQQGVRIFVWLVASADQFHSVRAVQLATLATQTNGAFFAFSGVEPIPDPEAYLENLRNAYFLAYDSRITDKGSHRLGVHVRTAALDITSREVEFTLDVQPPNVAFVFPPAEIKRSASPDQAADLQALTPRSQTLEILVEFPDSYERPLKRTALFVDGALAEVRESPPFDRFSWDLRSYTTTGRHVLKVEVEDSLGMSNTSVDTFVMVKIEHPTPNLTQAISRGQKYLAILAVVLAGAILLLVLILGGRLRPRSVGITRRRPPPADVLPPPPRIQPEPSPQRLPHWINRLHWPQRHLAPTVFGFLSPLSEPGESTASQPVSIISEEVTLGRDPTQATQLLDDPSVEALHARLRRLEDGSFRLSDEGSVAGTWINYTPVSREGARLEHGDLIHIGRVGFRFTLRQPERVRKPVLLRQEEG